jgi:hypothetical protein
MLGRRKDFLSVFIWCFINFQSLWGESYQVSTFSITLMADPCPQLNDTFVANFYILTNERETVR